MSLDFENYLLEKYGPGQEIIIPRSSAMGPGDSSKIIPDYEPLREWLAQYDIPFRYVRFATFLYIWFLEGEEDIAMLFKLRWG